MEEETGNPTFTFNGISYPFVASVATFRRQLENGGFRIAKLLTGTVRKFNLNGTAQFTTLPTAQNKIVYSGDGLGYRIEIMHNDPTGSYFRITAECDNKGI